MIRKGTTRKLKKNILKKPSKSYQPKP